MIKMSTLDTSLKASRHISTATTFESPVMFYMEILVG